jgi:hypothetical protein
LFLKNTQFINCKQHVQRRYDFPASKPVTADFPATKLRTDTQTPQTPVKPHGAR